MLVPYGDYGDVGGSLNSALVRTDAAGIWGTRLGLAFAGAGASEREALS